MKSKPASEPKSQTTEALPTTPVTLLNSSQERENQSSETERFSERKSERLNENPPIPLKRRTKRYSFEFYDDQILAIKRLVYEANFAGQSISQSDIVRAALDQYLNKEKK